MESARPPDRPASQAQHGDAEHAVSAGAATPQNPSFTTGRPPGSRSLLWAIVLGHAVKHVFASGFFILLPEIKASLALSNTGLGVFSTFRSVAGGVSNIPSGFFAERYTRRFSPMLAGILVFIGVFQIALARSVNIIDATIYASLTSMLFTAYHPPALGVLSRVYYDRRGLAISLHGTGASIGETLGPLLAGALLLVMSWRTVLEVGFIPLAVAALVLWLLTRRFPIESGSSTVGDYARGFAGLAASPQMLLVLAAAGAFAAAQSAVFTFLPVYVREDLAQSTLTVGVYVTLAQVVGIGAQPLMGYLLDRVGRWTVIVPALLGLSAALLTLYVAGEGPLFLLGLAVAGAFLFSTTALLVTAACDVGGDNVQATTVSIIYGGISAFTALGPLVSGFVADAFGVRSVFLYASAMAGLAAALGLAAGYARQRYGRGKAPMFVA